MRTGFPCECAWTISRILKSSFCWKRKSREPIRRDLPKRMRNKTVFRRGISKSQNFKRNWSIFISKQKIFSVKPASKVINVWYCCTETTVWDLTREGTRINLPDCNEAKSRDGKSTIFNDGSVLSGDKSGNQTLKNSTAQLSNDVYLINQKETNRIWEIWNQDIREKFLRPPNEAWSFQRRVIESNFSGVVKMRS